MISIADIRAGAARAYDRLSGQSGRLAIPAKKRPAPVAPVGFLAHGMTAVLAAC